MSLIQYGKYVKEIKTKSAINNIKRDMRRATRVVNKIQESILDVKSRKILYQVARKKRTVL